MKSVRFVTTLAVLLGPALLAGAVDLAMNSNPYTPIVTRNIFGLIPIPTNAPVDTTPVTPPPKITPNGTMTLFGKLEVLYKVAIPAKGKELAKDQSYVMSEGEREDDIEVVKIDQKDGIITFNNHGTIQDLPLVTAQNVAAATSVPGPVGSPGMPAPMVGRPANGFVPPGGPGAAARRGRGVSNAGNPNAAATTPFGGTATSQGANNNNMEAENLSPEAQTLILEKNRLDTQEAVDKGLLPPLPPTEITPTEATAVDGSPLNAPMSPQKSR